MSLGVARFVPGREIVAAAAALLCAAIDYFTKEKENDD